MSPVKRLRLCLSFIRRHMIVFIFFFFEGISDSIFVDPQKEDLTSICFVQEDIAERIWSYLVSWEGCQCQSR